MNRVALLYRFVATFWVTIPVLLGTLLLSHTQAQAQSFWIENFGDENLADAFWYYGGTNNGPAIWTWTPDPTAGYQEPDLEPFAAPTAANGYFYFNSDYNGQVPHDVWLTGYGNKVDCSGKTDVHLRFFAQYVYFNPDSSLAQVGISTNGTDFTYHDLFTGLPANLTYHNWVDVDLDEADNQPEVWLRFRWIGRYEYHWKIDDLSFFIPDVSNVDSCDAAVDISAYFGKEPGIPQTTGLFDNSTATVSATDPAVSCWNEAIGPDILNTTMWYTFTGDGGTYSLQTVPCNATNYIGTAQGDTGDTQMLVFSGDNCADLTAVVCNDDLFADGMPDWRAGLTLETAPAQRYYLLIDAAEMQGIVATGEFCIEITQLPAVPCAQGQAGNFNLVPDQYLCQGENLAEVLMLDAGSFTLPTAGQQTGLAWCFSPAPIPANTWPGDVPGLLSTPFTSDVAAPVMLNNGLAIPYGAYYLTPVVLGGGALVVPGLLPYVYNIDPSGACFFVGEALPIVLLPELSPLSATAEIENEMLPPGQNGSVRLSVSGGSSDYFSDPLLTGYFWSNTETSMVVHDLSAGTYTVTVYDVTGCVDSLTLSVTVDAVVGSVDPPSVRKLDLRPNPTSGLLTLDLELAHPAGLQLDLLTLQGQLIQTENAGTVSALQHTFDLSRLPVGTYLLRLHVDDEIALRQIVLQR
ncbi:MAG: T9SS type A sorting domain-containing protein [Lewinellaceae bacterium]|nr:T9SS type A sorting domain-containing protein [Saprospiraceae bacterium]MCB9332692.1 T9SS type A sorting domain-containing protein [Lewinellaceae bacterium]